MRAWIHYPKTTGMLTALLLGGVMLGGLWSSLFGPLREGHAAEMERLLDGFEMPVAAAVGKGDDLAKIDELHRLQKISGVLNARVDIHAVEKNWNARQLIWDGRPVGWLALEIAPTRWRRLHYRALEHLLTGGVLMALAGGLAGWIFQLGQGQHLLRLRRLSKLRQRRYRSHFVQLREKTEARILPWTRQALFFAAEGLVLLDGRQLVIAFNHLAEEALSLSPEAIGRHWLDLQHSPEWAQALQESIDHPGQRTPAPHPNGAYASSVLTLTPDATWIILHTAFPHPPTP